MPSYAQLQAEPVWQAQTVPPNMTLHLIAPLRRHFNLGPAAIGAPGDNNHLRGRHRSPRWCRTSRFSEDRNYGTVDARDLHGDQDWYRAIDVGISGKRLWDACHRLDLLVRAGQLPAVAEWFGSFDGKRVVGWFEGRPSSSDATHLWHAHVGFWTQYANDVDQLRLVLDAFTGGDDLVTTQAEFDKFMVGALSGTSTDARKVQALLRALPLQYPVTPTTSLLALHTGTAAKVDLIATKVDIDEEELSAIEARVKAGVESSADAFADAVVARLPAGALTKGDVADALKSVLKSGVDDA